MPAFELLPVPPADGSARSIEAAATWQLRCDEEQFVLFDPHGHVALRLPACAALRLWQISSIDLDEDDTVVLQVRRAAGDVIAWQQFPLDGDKARELEAYHDLVLEQDPDYCRELIEEAQFEGRVGLAILAFAVAYVAFWRWLTSILPWPEGGWHYLWIAPVMVVMYVPYVGFLLGPILVYCGYTRRRRFRRVLARARPPAPVNAIG